MRPAAERGARRTSGRLRIRYPVEKRFESNRLLDSIVLVNSYFRRLRRSSVSATFSPRRCPCDSLRDQALRREPAMRSAAE
jgi:hypothetical protein